MGQEKENRIKITVGEIFYCMFFCLLLFAKAIGLYDGQLLFKVFLVAACGCWLVKVFLTEYTVREVCLIGLLCLMAGMAYLCSGEKGALLYVFMITGLKNVDIKKVFACGCVAWTAGFVPLAVLNILHVADGPFKVHIRPLVGHVVRWSLGYAHPNVAHVSYLILVIFIVYLLDKRFSWKSCFLLMLGNIYVLLYTGSQTGFLTVSIYLMANIYIMYRKELGKTEQFLVQCIFPAVVIVSLVVPAALEEGTAAFEILNKVTNTRLRLSKYFLNMQSATFLGARMEDLVTPYKTMDNSYIFAYLTYGILLFAAICVGYMLLINVFCQKRKWKELAIITSIVIAGITEPFLFNTSFKNLSFLFMGELLFCFSSWLSSGSERIRLLSCHNKELFFPDCSKILLLIQKSFENHKRNVYGVALLIALGVGTFYAAVVKPPECILAPRTECDLADTEDMYLEENEVLESKEALVLGYVDDKTAMWEFSGNAVKAEYVRGIISSALLSGAFGGIIITVAYGIRDRKRNF